MTIENVMMNVQSQDDAISISYFSNTEWNSWDDLPHQLDQRLDMIVLQSRGLILAIGRNLAIAENLVLSVHKVKVLRDTVDEI